MAHESHTDSSRKTQNAKQATVKSKKTKIAKTIAELFQQGAALHQQGQLPHAEKFYRAVLEQQPRHFDALHMSGVLALQNNKPLLAVELINKGISVNPNVVAPLINLGLALKELGRLEEALASYDKAIAINPHYAEAFNCRGIVLKQLGHLDDALVSYDKAIALNAHYADAFYNRGITLKALNRVDEALESYDSAIAIKANYVGAFYNRGVILAELNRLNDALASYDKAIELKSNYVEAHSNRGNVLKDLNRLEDALVSHKNAIKISPNNAEGFYNAGLVLYKLQRLDEALVCYNKAIEIKPGYAKAFYNRGIIFAELNRLDEALASYDQAIAVRSDYVEVLNNRGAVLKELRRFDEALASYRKALSLKPADAEILYNCGNTLLSLDRLEEALACYDSALQINPDYEFLLGTKCHLKMRLCDWNELSTLLQLLESAIIEGKKVTNSFPLLSLFDKPQLQLLASKIYVTSQHPAKQVVNFSLRTGDGRIRIGYYSADFYRHATTYLMAELLECHDSQKFEIYGFSFGPNGQDDMHRRIAAACHHFFDVSGKSDREVAKLSRELSIDIAVDLKGYTQHARTGIFVERCAPIQVSYLGYPGTMGADYIDYIIADRTLIPHESLNYYTEKVVYLPGSYQVNDSTRQVSNTPLTKQEMGLPEMSFVFCCFNNNYKILPVTFDGWMRILKAVEGSVLWLFQSNAIAVDSLRRAAEVKGVDSSRLIFARRMKLEDHLARHQFADLFIDTFPYNAHTTASDALWAGLPVLTIMGKSFAARVAGSLLHAIGLPELVMDSQDSYEAKAIELAENPSKLSDVTRKLACNRLTSPLFKGDIFARNIEAAYSEMHKRYQDGRKPDHIGIG